MELWLSKLTRELFARGIFTWVDDLARKVLPCIKQHNKKASPFK